MRVVVDDDGVGALVGAGAADVELLAWHVSAEVGFAGGGGRPVLSGVSLG